MLVMVGLLSLILGMGLPTTALGALSRRYPIVATLHDYWWVCANAQLYRTYDGAMREFESSLGRLRTDHVDLLHRGR